MVTNQQKIATGRTGSDRCAWVTGASSGIGRALSAQLVADGWRVAGTSRNMEKLQLVRSELGGAFQGFPADVTNSADITALVTRIEKEVGPISLAVLNAGVYEGVRDGILDGDTANEILSVNVGGVVNCIAAIADRMVIREHGHIAVMSSLAGYRGLPGAPAYCASRSAVLSLAESLKFDFDQLGVKIQVITPGFVKTDMTAKNKFSMPFLVTPEFAAKRIVRGLQKSHFEITFPRRFSYLLKLMRVLPYRIYFPLLRKLTASASN